jgi:hypothetical protein
MPLPIRILKVDPNKRLIAQMAIMPSIKGVRTMIQVSKVAWRTLLEDMNGEKLLVAAKADRDRGKADKEWRIRGGENTAGISILFGTLDKKMEGMWHCPVSKEWLERNIVWAEPGEDADAAEVEAPNLDEDPDGAKLKRAEAGFIALAEQGQERPK